MYIYIYKNIKKKCEYDQGARLELRGNERAEINSASMVTVYTGFIGYGRVVTRTRRGHGSFHTQRLLTRGNGEASDGEGATG